MLNKYFTEIIRKMVAKTIDDALQAVGSFGKFQKILLLLSGLLTITCTIPNVLMFFAAKELSWKCVENSTRCTLNGTRDSMDTTRCGLPRSEWEYTESSAESLAAEFHLVCGNQVWIPIITSVFYVGYALSSMFFGRLADRIGRKNVLLLCTVGLMLT